MTNRPEAGEQQRYVVTEEGAARPSVGQVMGRTFYQLPGIELHATSHGQQQHGGCKAENSVVKQWEEAWEGDS